MGIPDYWIKLTKEVKDEDWPMEHLWHELNNRRPREKSISYAESHDQALVGDQTLIFRLIGQEMYDHMQADDPSLVVDRGMALHKLMRLITLATAGDGYLTFMGNEFGHPEWIDFPRPGNNWSYHYARRQWRLRDDPSLKYHFLAAFDRDMIALAREHALLNGKNPSLLHLHNEDKVVIFRRAGLVFAFNFHPWKSFNHYGFTVPLNGEYRMVLDSDAPRYGGHGRLEPNQKHFSRSLPDSNSLQLRLYLPSRGAQVLREPKS